MTRPPSRYWLATRRLTLTLFAVWSLLVFVTLFFARELDRIAFLDSSLSFFMAAQGLTLSFVLLLALYALCMRKIERRYGEPRA